MDPNFYGPLYGYRPELSLPDKWKSLKPIINQLYVNENRKLEDVRNILHYQHGFDAGIHQLKYHVRQWKLKKNVSTSAKTKMLRLQEARASRGKATVFEHKGRLVDNNKLARFAKSEISKSLGGAKKKVPGNAKSTLQGPKLVIAPRIFMKWNMPYGALRYSQADPINYISPKAVALTPGSDVVARTPVAHGPVSPSAEGVSKAWRNKTSLERAWLFVEGKHGELLTTMNKNEQVIMSTWLYQFWLFAYKTARHWGRGPRVWTKDRLDLDKHMEQLSISAAETPAAVGGSPAVERQHVSPSQWLMDGLTPSILCNWGVHVPGMTYERVPSPFSDSSDDDDDDALNNKDWRKSWKQESFVQKLRNGLANNLFSNVDGDELPIALPRLLQNSERSRDHLVEEALAFSLMGRNVDLMFSMAARVRRRGISIEGLYPFHLATAYLCGSYPCCNIFCGLLYLPQTFPLRDMYVNDRGHTVLDNLMIVIIKAHTRCVPGDVDDNMKRQRRFAGEEVDICGRWDADSDEVRALLARRASKIPFEWKHKFCHTSVQVICHCISLMFGASWRPDIDHPSGLFRKECEHCVQDLTLLPLHTLVMIAFQLAQRGCDEEDLFGVVACLLCLLCKGANPLLASELSASVLFGTDENRGCTHEALTPLQLAEHVPLILFSNWSPALRTGWSLLVHVLRLSQKSGQSKPVQEAGLVQNTSPADYFSYYITLPDDDNPNGAMDVDPPEDVMDIDDADRDDESVEEDIRHCRECGNTSYFQGKPELRDLWAAAQAELLTYRRLRDGDNWLSPNFSMQDIIESLDKDQGIRSGLIERELLRPYCDCGMFLDAKDEDYACVDEACKEYFSNLEEWERTTFLECPEKWQHEEEAEDEEYEHYTTDEEEDIDREEEEEDEDDDEDM